MGHTPIPDSARERVILLMDMDAYFASVEHICNPHLARLPVMVCGDPDTRTVVAAANYEARKFGVKAGMPASWARQACPQGIFIEGNPEKYVFFSLRLKSICQEFTPIVEVFSIDESFLDVTQTHERFGGPLELARHLKTAVREKLSITASVGISTNKLLAKTAAGLQKPDGLSTLYPEELASKFFPLPIRELFGIGEKTAEKLNLLGIKTIDDLRKFPLPILERLFGVVGRWMHQAANGKDDSPVIPEEAIPPPKSVGNNYTLPQDTSDEALIFKVLYGLCCKVGRRLRQSKFAGRTLALSVRFSNYQLISRSLTTDRFLLYDQELSEVSKLIYQEAIRHILCSSDRGKYHETPSLKSNGATSSCCAEMFAGNGSVSLPHRRRDASAPKFGCSQSAALGNQAIRLLGVSVSNLVSTENPRQLFFQDVSDQRYAQVIRTMDQARDVWGERTVTWGSLLPKS